MSEQRLRLNGITCQSCHKIINRVALANNAKVNSIDQQSGEVVIDCDQKDLISIKEQLASKGFGEKKDGEVGDGRGDPARVVKYISGVLSGQSEFRIESKLMNYSIISMIALIILNAVFYSQFISKNVQNAAAYLPLILVGILICVATVFSYQHMKYYRKTISCMNGMMAGMTIGMISGYLFGALVGATNGMFIGSVLGIAIGIYLGVGLGRCCGVMGAMEGAMAGLMAGVMGAMTSVMLIRDNLVLFLYILFGVCSFILGGLSYMMYRESGPAAEEEQTRETRLLEVLLPNILLSLLLVGIMIWGPKGIVVYP